MQTHTLSQRPLAERVEAKQSFQVRETFVYPVRNVDARLCVRGKMDQYTLIKEPPSVEAYIKLRAAAGLSPRSLQAATIGLAGTWYGVHIRTATETIAMGRIIGDGGCFFQVVDIAVLPAYQGQGLGTQIMTALIEHLQSIAPPTALVSLLADGRASDLYQKFGFTFSAPSSVGMICRF